MAGTEAIINKIIADAKEKADNIIERARIDGNICIDEAKDEIRSATNKCLAKKQIIEEETVTRRKTVAELDVKKIMLKAKKDAIDEAFNKAKEILLNLSSAEYLTLVSNMISAYAEDGDLVTIASNDKVITDSVVKDIANKKGIKLTLNKDRADFDGGVILSSNGIDKNLTFDVELKVLREELETTIANMIFNKE